MIVEGDLHAVVVAAVARVLAGIPTQASVTAALRALGTVDNATRATVARRIIGTAVLRLRLAHIAGSAQPTALVRTYVETQERGVPVVCAWPSDPIERMRVQYSCPLPLLRALADSMDLPSVEAFLAASNVPGPTVLRTHAGRATRTQLMERLRSEDIVTTVGEHAPLALLVQGHANLWGSAAWRDGWFEVQDQASQRVAHACVHDAPTAPRVVLDLCAGRGGKTLALAALLAAQPSCTLYAHDVDTAALRVLSGRAQRVGARVQLGLPAVPADVVLVDAPCTSTGVLRRWPDLRYTFADAHSHVGVQSALLVQAAQRCAVGGRVVYATCSVLRCENDDVIAAAPASLRCERIERFAPHVQGTDGFFIATLSRHAPCSL